MPSSRHLKPSHQYSVGDKIWFKDFFGVVQDLTHRRVKVSCLDERDELFERWVDPIHLRRRS